MLLVVGVDHLWRDRKGVVLLIDSGVAKKLQFEAFELLFIGALFEQLELLRFFGQMNEEKILAENELRVPLKRLHVLRD